MKAAKSSLLLMFSFMLIALAGCSKEYVLPAETPAYIEAAITLAERDKEHTKRDAYRKPAEVLMLSEIKPGDKVVEFAGFGHYYTTLLSSIVGPEGSVLMIDIPWTGNRFGDASNAFVATHPNTVYQLEDYNTVELPADLDLIFNVLYYHDLPLNDVDTASFNKRIFDALKPGGIYLIIDHNAESGSGIRDIETLHRIDPAVIRSEVLAAGFELALENTALLNSDSDDLSDSVFDSGMRDKTDKTLFKFRKPE